MQLVPLYESLISSNLQVDMAHEGRGRQGSVGRLMLVTIAYWRAAL